jgi:hypothetical protein
MFEDILAAGILAIAAAASHGQAPAQPAGGGAEGLWALETMYPVACRVAPEGQATVTRNGFLVTETHCRFGQTAPVGFRGMSGPLRCESEGMPHTSTVRMSMVGDSLLIGFDGMAPQRYRRC